MTPTAGATGPPGAGDVAVDRVMGATTGSASEAKAQEPRPEPTGVPGGMVGVPARIGEAGRLERGVKGSAEEGKRGVAQGDEVVLVGARAPADRPDKVRAGATGRGRRGGGVGEVGSAERANRAGRDGGGLSDRPEGRLSSWARWRSWRTSWSS